MDTRSNNFNEPAHLPLLVVVLCAKYVGELNVSLQALYEKFSCIPRYC